MYFKFTGPGEVLSLNRDGLAQSGLAVATRDRARAQAFARRVDGHRRAARRRRTAGPHAAERPDDDPLSQGGRIYNWYTLEVVQRIGYDSFTPSSGVLITKNKDQASAVGGPNSFNLFNWVIDANPEDIQLVDFRVRTATR